jgi:cytochrome c556
MRTLVAFLLAGPAIAQAPAYKPQPSDNLKQVMRSVPLPNSDIIFEVQSKKPTNDMQWQSVEKAAIAIQETGNLILLPGRLRSNGQPVPVQAADFVQFAQSLVTAGGKCRKAAQAKDLGAIANCTDALSEACDNCHKVYRDRP